MIVDVNVLVHATREGAPEHERAATWLTDTLRGDERVGLPWSSLSGFIRLSTHPRLFDRPLTPIQAHAKVDAWLAAPPSWIPPTDLATWSVYRELAERHDVRGNLVPDAHLAAMAVRHGVAVVSCDRDFARFPEVRWIDPLS